MAAFTGGCQQRGLWVPSEGVVGARDEAGADRGHAGPGVAAPEADVTVVGAGSEQAAVGREEGVVDVAGMALQRGDLLAGVRLPDTDRWFLRRGEQGAIG